MLVSPIDNSLNDTNLHNNAQSFLWGTNDTKQARDISANSLLALPCPAGYCQCTLQDLSGQTRCNFVFDSFFPNRQCSCNRTGKLNSQWLTELSINHITLTVQCYKVSVSFTFHILRAGWSYLGRGRLLENLSVTN